MDKLLAEFFTYKPSEQVHFLREPRFAELEESVRVEFLQKILLAEKISSKTMAAALKECGFSNSGTEIFIKNLPTIPTVRWPWRPKRR